ncbi:hypothetical protein EDD18DRAFT_1109831 [Armillaria luteobubalina]|uniref:Uncharacterized protein n=1 Tax=Armillaria luteobubalina TaxID=153913 RepID=A0AA39PSY5_9AGAR|nr:hypothetical protein EDD18DRAFT_1109831 [Armillaria luteobubalina]
MQKSVIAYSLGLLSTKDNGLCAIGGFQVSLRIITRDQGDQWWNWVHFTELGKYSHNFGCYCVEHLMIVCREGDQQQRWPVYVGDAICYQVTMKANPSNQYTSSSFKFKLRLQAFLSRLKHRGKPCLVSLLTLPNELLQEIAYFLCKHDQKALHSIYCRADIALSTTMLSAILINITLPFSNHGQEILEYISRQPAGYIHKLRICIWGLHAEHHTLTDVAEGDNPKDTPRSSHSRLETKANLDVFHSLYNRALASMNNLQAMTLCISNGARKAPPSFFQDTFNSLMKLPTIDLHLTHPEFTLPYFSHLSHLKSLQISNFDLYDTSSGFWIELARQGIHIPSITLKSRGVPSTVIDYLVSNEGMAELTFEVETDRGNISKRVLSTVVPRHSRTLEVLHLTSCWGSHWTIGHLPEYAVGVSQCSNLCILGIIVEGSQDFVDPVLSLLKFLPNLQTLRLVAHTNDFTLVIVSISYLGCIKFVAGRMGWDLNDEERDVLRDDPWYLSA